MPTVFPLLVVGTLLATTTQGPARPVTTQGLRPIAAPVQRIERTLDLRTGRLARMPEALGAGGLQTVYANTCHPLAFYLGLRAAGAGGTGSPHADAVGDFGAVPSTRFAGDGTCTPGTCDAYDIRGFEISYCTLNTSATIELNVWDAPQRDCPACSPFGGTKPPRVPPAFATTLAGLPASPSAGTLMCYVLNVTLAGGGFQLTGSDTLGPSPSVDRFLWTFSMPTTTGQDGPALAGFFQPPMSCAPCVGTLFEVGGPSTGPGTGAGQRTTFLLEDFGGTVPVPSSAECYAFGSTITPAGTYLQLFAAAVCAPAATSFCDAPDGSLASCPCANPGSGLSGCDTPFPGSAVATTTGGVHLRVTGQQLAPQNRASVVATGFPANTVGSGGGPNPAPSALLLQSPALNPLGAAVFGDGVLCLAGTPARVGGAVATDCILQHAFAHGTSTGSFYYQLWFRSTPSSYCNPAAAYNTTNGVTLTW